MNNFSVNRSKLKNILEDNQMAVVFSGNPIQKLGDEYFPFTPNRNFYYLTGLDRPKMIYFVSRDREIAVVMNPEVGDFVDKLSGLRTENSKLANNGKLTYNYSNGILWSSVELEVD